LIAEGFPEEFKSDVEIIVNQLPLRTYNNVNILMSYNTIHYVINNQSPVEIPYRIYLIDASDGVINSLNIQQKMILHCIYSRSCNGFVRQKHLKSLLSMEYADFVIPYIVKASDEYVIEILAMIYNILAQQDTMRIRSFCMENAGEFQKGYSRMISYWNVYYRNKGNSNNYLDYAGYKLFNECYGYSAKIK